MESIKDQDVYLALAILALAVFVVAAVGLFFFGNRSAKYFGELALVTVAGLAIVFLGVSTISTMTNRRGAPGETAPWLTLIAIAAGIIYFRVRRRRHSIKPQTGREGAVVSEKRRSPSPAETTPSARVPPPRQTGTLIFVSYRRSDSSDVTGRIYDRLVQHFGKDCVFKDVDSIPLGVDFREHLSGAVGRCHVLLAVIGRGWLGGDKSAPEHRLDDLRDFVRIEIESAIERRLPIIPILVQQAVMPTQEELPTSLHPLVYRNAIAVRSDPDFHQDVGRLIKGIEAHLRTVGRDS